MMGSSEATGVPGNGVDLALPGKEITSLPSGWLYIQVAANTVEEPTTKEGVSRKSKSTTDAKKERTMAKLVANPLRMLSEYLMTTAVTKPPKTWIPTVAQAQPPKFFSKSPTNP